MIVKNNIIGNIMQAIVIIAILLLTCPLPNANANTECVEVKLDASVNIIDRSDKPYNEIQKITFSFSAELDQSNPIIEKEIEKYLKDLSIYSFTNEWPGSDTLNDISGDNPPFVPDKPPDVIPTGDLKPTWSIQFTGQMRGDGRGAMHVKQYQGFGDNNQPILWKLKVSPKEIDSDEKSNDIQKPKFKDDLTIGINNTYSKNPKTRIKADISNDTENFVLNFSYSKLLNSVAGKPIGNKPVTSLSFACKIPFNKPFDVKEATGAETESSGEVPDLLELAINSYRYQKGGNLNHLGFKARAAQSFDNWETVLYYSPLTGWFNESHGFYGAEFELGYRNGDGEWKNLTTMAPDRGNFVGRGGMVVEWAPEIGLINQNLAEGLRFYVRGRGWADMYDNDQGNRDVRFREFIDSEIFYNFSDNYRIFIRGEWGYLPPDLSRYKNRIFAGVGSAF